MLSNFIRTEKEKLHFLQPEDIEKYLNYDFSNPEDLQTF